MLKKALVAMLLLEGVSVLTFFYPKLSLLLLVVVFAATLVAAWRHFEWGIYILFAELFVGSRGHLLEYDLGFVSLSLRLVIFLAVGAAALKVFLQDPAGTLATWRRALPASFWLLLVLVLGGVVNGILSGQGAAAVLLDGNGYFYLAALPLALLAVKDRQRVEALLELLGAAVLVIALQTLLVFLWFRFGLPGTSAVYAWVLGQEIGEITGHVGQASRIFMQSQFFALVGVFIFAFRDRPTDRLVFFAAVFAVLMSLSRSFWLGGAVAAVFIVGLFALHQATAWREAGEIVKRAALLTLLAGAVVYLLFYLGGNGGSAALAGRIENPAQEAAGQARLLLLPELLGAIGERPLFGHGFGKELVYLSFLPDRITLDNPTGAVRTFAFEWGYLDLAVKLGLLGLLVYLWFIGKLFKSGIHRLRVASEPLVFGFLGGVAALAVLNVTTPYLNHPLGIGYLALCFVSLSVFTEA